MALFVLRKLILQMRMHSHPVGLDVWFLVGLFLYFHTSCVQTAKALVRLRGCTVLSEPSLITYVISTIISWAGSFYEWSVFWEIPINACMFLHKNNDIWSTFIFNILEDSTRLSILTLIYTVGNNTQLKLYKVQESDMYDRYPSRFDWHSVNLSFTLTLLWLDLSHWIPILSNSDHW